MSEKLEKCELERELVLVLSKIREHNSKCSSENLLKVAAIIKATPDSDFFLYANMFAKRRSNLLDVIPRDKVIEEVNQCLRQI